MAEFLAGLHTRVGDHRELSCVRIERSHAMCVQCLMQYDSRPDTEAHILRVRELLYIVQSKLEERGFAHDQSKLADPEKTAFDEVGTRLKTLTYGSPEYAASLKELGPALAHHYAHNSHHPEHVKLYKCVICGAVLRESETWCPNNNDNPNPLRLCGKCCPNNPIYECEAVPHLGVEGMTLLDVVEMLMDWKAASERHDNGCIRRSIEQNTKRFNLSSQIVAILRNTVEEMGW